MNASGLIRQWMVGHPGSDNPKKLGRGYPEEEVAKAVSSQRMRALTHKWMMENDPSYKAKYEQKVEEEHHREGAK